MEHTIADILGHEKLQHLTDHFYSVTGISTSVVDENGNILAGSGWQEICSRFHRAHENTMKKCMKTAAGMQDSLQNGNSQILCKCPNGLYDAAVPVFVDGRHAGSLFAGQFLLYRPDISDIERFSERARFAGFDEIAYLNALEKVPTVAPAYLDEILTCLKRLAAILSKMGSENGRQKARESLFSFFDTPCRLAGNGPQCQSTGYGTQASGPAPAFRMGSECASFSLGAVQDFNKMLSMIIGYSERLLKETDRGSSPESGRIRLRSAPGRARDLIQSVTGEPRPR